MKIFLLLFIANISLIQTGYSQEKRYYHTFKTSDSDIRLTKWRVPFEEKGDTYIIETVDNQNRVKEIRLIQNGKLYESDCYDISIIKFEYKQDTIIQYNMVNDSTYSAGIECGEPAKIVYILENNRIKESLSFIDYDIYLKGDFRLEPDFRTQLEKDKIKNKNGIKSNYNFIWAYQFSSVKYKGYIPAKEYISFKNYDFQYTESSKKSPYAMQNCRFLYQMNEN
ncbi:MAG: hypothetical protein K9H49_05855 [Bacteroidales bacterium]|nr:hypothetical protein [Bacteroidales bacterium]MCF8404367.1 hypothetical protein [Bacteroidales bacterium]